jgi:hypothetical protein
VWLADSWDNLKAARLRGHSSSPGGKFMGQRKSQRGKSTKQLAATRLDCRLERRLISYAVAATAAGVGALACSPEAEAKVVYVNTWIPIASGVTLDLNNDGIADFQFSIHVGAGKQCSSSFTSHRGRLFCGAMKVLPQNPSNAIWGTNGYASALGSGVSLGSQGKFQSGHDLMTTEKTTESHYGSWGYSSAGPWKETSSRFLGLKFLIQGQVHYGWARLNVSSLYAAISGYAYETQPNTPILTGQENGAEKKRHKGNHAPPSLGAPEKVPSSLGMLAGGSPSLQAAASPGLGRE